MSLKAFGLMAPLALGGLYATGALGGGFAAEVERPPAQVMAALADLDIRRQPGNPGTDPSRSGGVRPVFQTERGSDSISWIVTSRGEVATRMTAFLQPLKDGRGTRVTATVERGDAPDEFTPPAFRSTGLTLALFGSAIQDELNELTAPPRASAEACDALRERIADANIASGSLAEPRDATEAVGQSVGNVGRIVRMERRLRELHRYDKAGGRRLRAGLAADDRRLRAQARHLSALLASPRGTDARPALSTLSNAGSIPGFPSARARARALVS